MKRLWFLFLLLGSIHASAQTVVTNRQMYNFNEGDTIQWSSPFSLCWQQAMYEERVFLGKEEKPGCVIYTVKDTRKYNCGSCPFTDRVLVHDIQINDLDTSVLFSETPAFQNCSYHVRRDTVYTDASLGGKIVYGIIYPYNPLASGSACRMHGKKLFIEGIGELYDLLVTVNNDPCVYRRVLEFYHKVGEAPYGKRVIVPPSPPFLPEKLEVYPTSIDDNVIHVDYRGEGELRMIVLTTDGRSVKEEVVQSGSYVFNLNVNPGIYIVKFYSSNYFNGKFFKIFVK